MEVSLSGPNLLEYPSAASTQSTQGPTSQESAERSTQKSAESSDQDDTVKISLNAQIKNLRKEGMNVTQIAHNLGLDTKTVNTYLYGDASGTTTQTQTQKPEMPQRHETAAVAAPTTETPAKATQASDTTGDDSGKPA